MNLSLLIDSSRKYISFAEKCQKTIVALDLILEKVGSLVWFQYDLLR